MTTRLTPTGTVDGDIALVTAAALAAKTAGEKAVYLDDGHWRLDGVTVADIHDRYLVMENGTFSINSLVFPFRPNEWLQRTRTTPNSGSRGRVAIELDDTTISHWRYIFPVAKDLGIPITVAWHLEDTTSGWVPEAHRHGWGVMSHLPGNYPATDMLANGTLDQLAQQSLDAIHDLTGAPDAPVGFVYPQHIRSQATDEVLRKYYAWGRGMNSKKTYEPGMPTPWLVSSTSLDTGFLEAGVSEDLKRLVREVARTNGNLSCYFHVAYENRERQVRCLKEFVHYAQSLGINFVTSYQLYTDHNLVDDPYMKRSGWSVSGAASSMSTEVAYHGGRSAYLASPADARTSPSVTYAPRMAIPTRAGNFTKLRVSYRIKSDTLVKFASSAWGVQIRGALDLREHLGGRVAEPGLSTLSGVKSPAGEIPPGEWVQHHQDIYVPPVVEHASLNLAATNLEPGHGFYIDEVRVVPMGWVREYTTTATLNGTGNVSVPLPMGKLEYCRIRVEPQRAMRGDLTVETTTTPGLLLKSSSSGDTMPVRITVTPRQDYYIDE